MLTPLVLGELVGRGLTWAPPAERVPQVRMLFSETTLGDWLPNQTGIVAARPEMPFQVHVNEAGFRNVDPIASDAIRVLVLGDSQTFGQYVSTHDTWTRIAQRRWNAEHPERVVQLLNGGMSGATIADYVDYLKEKGKRLSPDAVLIATYDNDVSDLRKVAVIKSVRSRLKGEKDRVRFSALRVFLGAHSGLYNWMRGVKDAMLAALGNAPVTAAVPPARFDRSEDAVAFRKLALEAVDSARATGAAVGMIYIGSHDHKDARPREISMAIAAERGVPSLDLHDLYERHRPEDLFLIDPLGGGPADYPSDSHLSRYGHRVTGFAVAEFLAAVIPAAPS